MERIKKSLRTVTSSIHQQFHAGGGSESPEALHHHHHTFHPHGSLLAFYQQRHNRPVESVRADGSLIRRNWSHDQLDANSRQFLEHQQLQSSASSEAINTIGSAGNMATQPAKNGSNSQGASPTSDAHLLCPGSAQHKIFHPLLIHRQGQNQQVADPDLVPHHGSRPAGVKRGIIHAVHNSITKSQSWTHLHLLGGGRKRHSSNSLAHENGNSASQPAEEALVDKPKRSSATPDAFTGGDVISRVVLGSQYLPRLAEALSRVTEQAGGKSHTISKDVFVEILFGRARTLAGKIFDHLVRKAVAGSSHAGSKKPVKVGSIPEKQFVSELNAFARPALDADSVRLYLSLFVEDLEESNMITEMDFAEFLHCCYVSAAGLDGEVIDVQEGMVAIKPVLQTAFHRKTEVSTGYLQSWILRNCPRLILPLSTIVNDSILDAYVKLCCKQGVELAISSIPHDEERSHLPVVVELPSKNASAVGFQIGAPTDDGFSASVVPKAELWILSASLPGVYLRPHPVSSECPAAAATASANGSAASKDVSSSQASGKVPSQQHQQQAPSKQHGVLRKAKSDNKHPAKPHIKFTVGPGNKPLPDEVDIDELDSSSDALHLNRMSPLQSHTEWNVLYDSCRHGKKLSDFIDRAKGCKTPTVMLIFAEDDYTLCIGVDSAWRDAGSFWGGEDSTALLISPEYRVLTTGAKILCFNNAIEGFTKGLMVGEDPRNPLIKVAGKSFDVVDYRQIPLGIQRVVLLSVADDSNLIGPALGAGASEFSKLKHKLAAKSASVPPTRALKELLLTRDSINKEELREERRVDMGILKLGLMNGLVSLE